MAPEGGGADALDSREVDGFVIHDLVAEPDDALLSAVYDRVLEPSFAVGELEPLEIIRDQVTDPRHILRMLAYFGADGAPVAVMTCDWYARSRVALIGYLAVRPDLRRRGTGTKLIGHATGQWAAELNPALGLAEVENPRLYQGSDNGDTGDPVDRLRLYESLGGRVISVPYFQPKLADELERVHGLMLMAFVVNGRPLAEVAVDSVPTAPIGVFLDEYFEAAEGPPPPQDAEFLNLKARVLSTPEAPLLTSGELDRIPEL
jgi:GNAT superfamily N-acetyltransferase